MSPGKLVETPDNLSCTPPPRVVIEHVSPEIDAGRFPIKRVVGDSVEVSADIFADGHDSLSAVLQYRQLRETGWQETAMRPLGNDRWSGSFRVLDLTPFVYTLLGWVDHFKTWRRDMEKRLAAAQDVAVDLLIGAELVRQAAERATGSDAKRLLEWADAIANPGHSAATRAERALSDDLGQLMSRYADRRMAARYERELLVSVDRQRAGFSAWYELFPRSLSDDPARPGTFRDVMQHLPYVADMGFDVLYLPPIHPIGRSNRKGPNNTAQSSPNHPGSPWAIGGTEGGHKAIHPDLGTLEDFKALLKRSAALNVELAIDIAFQATPDHPYVQEHPEWFRKRPDGTIQYAENPPKKYQDIYPFDFETPRWRELWEELKSVVTFWVEQGVRIFRVDNPHTKPFAFWEFLIGEIRRDYPECIFLSEAFTRPKVMYRLAKLGFTQSYTYFTWRNTSWELKEYLTELTQTEAREYFRPNFWPNTPDILPEYLQYDGRAAFMARLVLAATLSSNYGIYGPAFELMENRPLAPGKEEYLDSEKYEIRAWDWKRHDSLHDFIGRVNRVRRENPALHSMRNLRFHETENDQLIAYSKATDDLQNIVLCIVNLDPWHRHSGWLHLPLPEFRIEANQTYQAHDLLSGARFLWQGERNYVELDPQNVPAHLLLLRRRLRREHDFDYYM